MKQYFCRVLQRGLCAKMSVTLVALLPVQVFCMCFHRHNICLCVLRPIFYSLWCLLEMQSKVLSKMNTNYDMGLIVKTQLEKKQTLMTLYFTCAIFKAKIFFQN